MPSDLNISSPPGFASGPSYRPQVRGRGAGSTRVLLAGAGAAALLAVGVASWGLTGGEAPIPPVIEADPRPLRVKPENAGGLQVAGTEEQAANPAVGRRDGLAPAAEAPAPLALRAQLGAGRLLPDIPEPAPIIIAPAPPAAPPPAAVSPPPARSASAPSGAAVQLAAVGSEEIAKQEWQRLSKRMPDLLGDRAPVIQRLERDGRTIWRLRTGGFADTAEATSFCVRLRAKGLACTIGSF